MYQIPSFVMYSRMKYLPNLGLFVDFYGQNTGTLAHCEMTLCFGPNIADWHM